MIRINKSFFIYLFILCLFAKTGHCLQINSLPQTSPYNIISPVTSVLFENSSEIVSFSSLGTANSITVSSNNYGIVNINKTYNHVTTFGANGLSIGTLNTANAYTFTLGNTAYIDNLNVVSGATLALGMTGTVNGSINLASGGNITGTVKGNGTTLNVNRTYNDSTTTLGANGNNLNELNLATGYILTLSARTAYVDNLNVSSGSTLTIEANGALNGTIKGETDGRGIVVLNKNYNNANTTFGENGNSIGRLNINNTYTFTLGNTSYITLLNVLSGSTLALGTTGIVNGNIDLASGGNITGTVKGNGTTLNLNTNYDNTVTSFGVISSHLEELNVGTGNTLTLSDKISYITYLDLASNSVLTIADSNTLYGTIRGENDGEGTVNLNASYISYNDTKFGENGHSIETLNIGDNCTLTLNSLPSSINLYANTINLQNSGNGATLATSGTLYNITLNGNIITQTNSTGILDINNNTIINGSIGNSGASLNSITIADYETLIIDSTDATRNIYADTITLEGFATGSILVTRGNANNIIINSNIITQANSVGTLDVNNTTTINGSIGDVTNRLNLVNIENSDILTIDATGTARNIYSNAINLEGADAELNTTGNSLITITGDIVPGINGVGILDIDTDTTLNGSAGSSGINLNSIAVADSKNLVIDSTDGERNIYANTIILENSGNGATITTTGDTDNDLITINGTITTQTNSIGTININNNTIIEGTIGTISNRLDTIGISDANALTLTNNTYVSNDIILTGTDSTLNLTLNADVYGTIKGNATNEDGTVNIDTTNQNYDDDYTTFGTGTNSIGNLNIYDGNTLTIGQTNVYADTITLQTPGNTSSIGSTFTTSGTGTRTITGDMIVENDGISIFNANTNTIFYGSIGTADNRVNTINLASGQKLTLDNSVSSQREGTYINTINMDNTTSSPILRITGDSSGYLFDGNILYSDMKMCGVIVSLNGDVYDEGDKTQIQALGELIGGTYIQGISDVLVADNTLYFIPLSLTVTEGQDITLDNGNFVSYTDSVRMVYDSIFTQLSVIANDTSLSLHVDKWRYPDNKEISKAGITTGYLIDGWKYEEMDASETEIVDNIQHIESEEEFLSALNDLAPDVSGAIIKTSFQTVNNSFTNTTLRMDKVRTVKLSQNEYYKDNFLNNTLYASADTSFRNPYYSYDLYRTETYKKSEKENTQNLWTEVFGRTTEAERKEYIDGYRANTYGITLGYDNFITNNSLIGTSYTFSYSDVDSTPQLPKSQDSLNIISHNVNLYSTLYGKNAYLDLIIGGTLHNYDGARTISFENYHEIARSNYNGYGVSALIGSGYNFKIYTKQKKDVYLDQIYAKQKIRENDKYKVTMKDIDNSVIITPNFSLLYSGLKIDPYTEKGAESANLQIKTEDSQKLEAEIGIKLLQNSTLRNRLVLQKMLSFGTSYDFLNEKPEITARFINDDEEFKVYGYEPEPILYKTGVGMFVNKSDNLNLGIQYNYDFNKDIKSHTVKFDLLIRF